MKWYVGHPNQISSSLVSFQSTTKPTSKSHGHKFSAVIGPFKTKRAAKWAEKYGANNPHFTCVEDAEKLSK